MKPRSNCKNVYCLGNVSIKGRLHEPYMNTFVIMKTASEFYIEKTSEFHTTEI